MASRRWHFVAAGGDDLAPGQLGQQHAGGADPARCAQHQHGLAGLDATAFVQHAIGGAVGAGQGGGLDVGHAVGDRHQLAGPNDAVFGHRAASAFAQHVELAAFPVDVMRDRQDAVADLPAVDAVTQRIDDAGAVAAGDAGQFDPDAGHAAAGEHVEIVQPAGRDLDPHPAGRRHRLFDITGSADRQVAMRFEIHRFHRRSFYRRKFVFAYSASNCTICKSNIGRRRQGASNAKLFGKFCRQSRPEPSR